MNLDIIYILVCVTEFKTKINTVCFRKKKIKDGMSSDYYVNMKGKKVLPKVQQYKNALEYASDELKNDKQVILTVVQQNGWSLKYASDELKNDKEVVLKAVQESDMH